MLLFKVLRLFSRKSKLNLDLTNAVCMGHAPTLNHVTVYLSPPIIADFCAHLFSKGISYCVAVVGALLCILSFRFLTVSSNFACWLKILADLFQRDVCCIVALLHCCFAACCVFAKGADT